MSIKSKGDSQTDVGPEGLLARNTLASLTQAGFDRAACRVSADELHELQAENSEINLFRTNFETDISLVGIADERKASISINQIDEATVNNAVADLRAMAAGSSPDSAHDIACHQPHETFNGGIAEPNYDLMYDRVAEMQTYASDKYPTLNLRSTGVTFYKRKSCFVNSNDVCFQTSRGLYQVSISFSSKEGTDTSSMMYTGYSSYDLDTPIFEATNVDMLLRQSTEQVRTEHIPGKFQGEMIISPDCLTDFLGFMLGRISDGSLISGTSVFKDKLNEAVASPLLSIHSRPVDDALTGGYWVTGGGFKAENSTILDQGVLKTYLLGQYGANKTGLDRAVNSGGNYCVDAGESNYEDLISSVKEGILITRFSGGRPNDRGDFSGIAKNSYYIKDGKVAFPVKETTVSGNMVDLLQNISGISKERLNFGGSVLPWVKVSGIKAS
ncbi:MAG: PmbA protein [Candidatus Azotimanducaceae bacterium]|jgi:PmbA protein